jgi:hypothetical protein
MRNSKLASILIAGAATLVAANALTGSVNASGDDWEKDWTALTISSTGAWGAYTSPSRIEAMIGAMAQCRENAGVAGSGCGSHIATLRGGWSVGFACDSETYISTGSTYAEANAAAIQREIELRQLQQVDIGACRRLVAIGPDGQQASQQMLSEVLPIIPERTGTTAPDNGR